MRLKNKVAIITGAAQGIGEATARRFVAEGAYVILVDRQEEQLKNLVSQLNEFASYYVLDITNRDALSKFVKDVADKHKRIDILVNNAGITKDSLTVKMTDEAWSDVINVNLKAPFMLVQEIFPMMKEQNNGVILNASSVSSLGNIGQANYAASKAGIIAMTKTWALEFARYNVRVNAVAPGFTATPMVNTVPEKVKDALIDKIPLKRFAEPEEIAAAYCYLASDDAKYVTGQVLFVDGGLTCGF
ncbi:MAG: 3-oxoacyl-ACP reductase FabG [Candidatus Sericytochromatia bacterium]|nr:3-oxoacyl-ACP reductase FabG [Candidatus Sericytochromatia bacterium]